MGRGGGHVVAAQCAHRHHHEIRDAEAPREIAHLRLDLLEARLLPVDKIHFVHAHNDVLNSEQRGDLHMTTRLRQHAVTRVD